MFPSKHRSAVLVAVFALALGVPAASIAAINPPGSNGGVTIGAGGSVGVSPMPVGPGGGFPLPGGGFTLPSGGFTFPGGGFTLPGGGFTLPSGGFTLPGGGFPVPGSNGGVTIGAGAGGYGR